jgi:hypothetical protein
MIYSGTYAQIKSRPFAQLTSAAAGRSEPGRGRRTRPLRCAHCCNDGGVACARRIAGETEATVAEREEGSRAWGRILLDMSPVSEKLEVTR